MPENDQQVTRLLKEWAGGNKQALDQLMPLVYDQLNGLELNLTAAEAGNLKPVQSTVNLTLVPL